MKSIFTKISFAAVLMGSTSAMAFPVTSLSQALTQETSTTQGTVTDEQSASRFEADGESREVSFADLQAEMSLKAE